MITSSTHSYLLFFDSDKLPDGSVIEGPSKLDILSESIVDKSALNDLDSLEYEDEGMSLKNILEI